MDSQNPRCVCPPPPVDECCPDIPWTLHFELSSSCAALDGVSGTLLFIGDGWVSGTIPYGNCFLGVNLVCYRGEYRTQVTDTPGGMYQGFAHGECDPFRVTFSDMLLQGRLPCCGSDDTLVVVIEATPTP